MSEPWDISIAQGSGGPVRLAGKASGQPSGGSLPDWWTVDSTPGAESVDFAGSVFVSPPTSDTQWGLKIVGAAGSGDAYSALLDVWSDVRPVFQVDAGGDCAVTLTPGGSDFRVQTSGGGQLFKIKDDGTIGFFGTATAAQQTLDAATCTTVDIANKLIASKFMAAA